MRRVITFLFVVMFSASSFAEGEIAIAIHGGAGTISKANLTDEQKQDYLNTLDKAVSRGYELLQQGGDSITAIQAAIVILEDSPLFNAGIGSVYTFDEEHELDASIMDGKTLNAGAVSGVTTVKNPILLAYDVMEKSRHVMLSGVGAESFAAEMGYEQVENSIFNTKFRHDAWKRAMASLNRDKQASVEHLEDYKFGTVGAVALDKSGNLAAGTSTGGMTLKRWGRIGDAPIIGAGTYADNESCAVSATGHGEYFIRYNVASDICARMKYQGLTLQNAADTVINDVLKNAGGDGGVIAVDAKGNVSMPFNTEGMYRAKIDKDGKKQVAIH